MLRARSHFCFIQTFLWSWFVFFCVGDSKKKKSHKGQKKTTKSTRERTLLQNASFLDSILYARTHLYICAFKTSSDDCKTRSLFTSVCFSFVGVRRFIAKTDDYCTECSFFLITRGGVFSTSFSVAHVRERNVTPKKNHALKKWHHRQRRRRSRKRRR